MLCPRCGSFKVSETKNLEGIPDVYTYRCIDCQDGFDEDNLGNVDELIHLFSDGACSKNPGPAGAGVLMRYKKYERRISKFLGDATNNIAELTAILIGLKEVKSHKRHIPVKVYTDSQYSIGVLSNLTWKPKKNVALINDIKALISTFDKVTFVKVKGHSDHIENNITDKLAVDAYRTRKNTSIKNCIK